MNDAAMYRRAKEIFLAVCDAPQPDRTARARALCADDESLRALVEDLLREDEVAAEVTAGPEGSGRGDGGTPMIGRRIGRYTITGLLGEGGMGVVYEAQQESPARAVALKLIRPEFATPRAMRRFELEAVALGRLRHPGIAQIYEAGWSGRADRQAGTPYFAMELVRGVPLLDYAGSAGLDVPERLELMARIADAVHHAHQKGVIHRDLKPANILIEQGEGADATGARPKILDFGIARVLEESAGATRHTSAGQLVGTVRYMSPEQAGDDPAAVDTRTDIYSLGAIAFELLAGRGLHPRLDEPGVSLTRSLAVIREEDPARLGAIDHRLRGDVETVIGRAVERDRERRYASAAEFAADLRRVIRHETIHARPATLPYQFRKFTRRNRPLVVGTAAVLGALLVGLVGVTLALGRALEARAAEEQQRAVAEAINEFLSEDLLGSVSPFAQGREVSMREVLDAASERIGTRFSDRPVVEAVIRWRIGETYWQLGERELAEPHLARALELHRQYPSEDPDALPRSLTSLGHIYHNQGRIEEAEALYREALEILTRVLGESASETLDSMCNVATILRRRAAWEEAVPLAERCLALCRRHLPEQDQARLAAAEVLAGIYRDLQRHDEAISLYEEVMHVRRASQAGDSPDVLRLLNSIAAVHEQAGEREKAERSFAESLSMSRRVLGERHPQTLVAMTNLANLYGGAGEIQRAVPLYREALTLSREVLGPTSRGTLITMSGLGRLLRRGDEDERKEAEALLLEAVLGLRKHYGEDDVHSLTMSRELALLYMDLDRPGDAEPFAAAAVEGTRRSGWSRGFLAASLRTYEGVLKRMGREEQAAAVRAELATLQGPSSPPPPG